MRIDWIVPCRYAETHGDGTALIAGAGADTLWLEGDLPQQVGVLFALRIVGAEDEWDDAHELEVRLRRSDPTEPEEETLKATFRMPELPPLKREGWEAGMILRVLPTWEVTDLGPNTLAIYLDGTRKEDVTVDVRSASELQVGEGDGEGSPDS